MENKDPKNNPKKFSFNSYWIYGIIILVILSINMSVMITKKTEVISQGKFEQLANEGVVDSVVVVNYKYVNVYLTEQAIKS